MVSSRITLTQNGKLATMQFCGALTGAVGDAHSKIRGIIIENGENQGGPGLGTGVDVVWEVAPHYFTGSGFTPPFHDDSSSIRLERTERLTFCGTRFLICRS